MTNQKVTELEELTVAASTDILYIVDDPGGTAISKKITIGNLGIGSGAGEINIELSPQNAKLPSSNPMVIDGGENNWKGLFDDTTDESATWEFIVDDDHEEATLYADIYYTMASATSGDVVWEAYVMAITPGDSADINTDSYDTVNYITDTVPGTAGYLAKATITLTNKDSLAAGDYVRFKIARDADSTNDTDNASGDAELIKVVIRE